MIFLRTVGQRLASTGMYALRLWSLPPCYSYDYGGHRINGTDPAVPVLACRPRGPVPLPEQVPVVAWRAGLDINPLDVTNDDDVRWLQWAPLARLAPCQ